MLGFSLRETGKSTQRFMETQPSVLLQCFVVDRSWNQGGISASCSSKIIKKQHLKIHKFFTIVCWDIITTAFLFLASNTTSLSIKQDFFSLFPTVFHSCRAELTSTSVSACIFMPPPCPCIFHISAAPAAARVYSPCARASSGFLKTFLLSGSLSQTSEWQLAGRAKLGWAGPGAVRRGCALLPVLLDVSWWCHGLRWPFCFFWFF